MIKFCKWDHTSLFYWHKIPKVLISEFHVMIGTKLGKRFRESFLSFIDYVFELSKSKGSLPA